MTTSELIDIAKKTAPLLREHAAEGERTGRLPRPSLEALRTGGFFRLFTPRSLGGHEADPVTVARVTEELARADAAAAWAIMVASSGAWGMARFPDQTAEEVFRDRDALIASAFTSPVMATPVRNGYRIHGRSPFASYMKDAAWAMATAVVQPMREGSPPSLIAALMPREQAEVVDTWNAMGMRATESNDVVYRDVVVPEHRTYPLVGEFAPGRHFRGPLYRIPAMASSVGATIAPVAVGIGAEAVEEVARLAQEKTPFSSSTLLRDRPHAQLRLAQAEGLVRSARHTLHAELAACWERAQRNEPSTLEQKSHMLLAAIQAVQQSAQAVEIAYTLAGGSAVYERNRLARLFRDAQVVKQHGLVSEPRYQTVGQVRLGLAPEMAFVAL